jgi:hypothetical protein
MPKRVSINWDEVENDLDHAPDDFLQAASKLRRSKLSEKRLHQSQKTKQDALGDKIRKDAEQQTLWKEAHNTAIQELIYSGEFTDKNQHIRLLQRVKVIKHTAKQIHLIAAYTLVLHRDEAWQRAGRMVYAARCRPEAALTRHWKSRFSNFSLVTRLSVDK